MNKKPTDMLGFASMVAIIGLVGGFAERIVPSVVQSTADKMENRAGTPDQAAQAAKAGTGGRGKQADDSPKQ